MESSSINFSGRLEDSFFFSSLLLFLPYAPKGTKKKLGNDWERLKERFLSLFFFLHPFRLDDSKNSNFSPPGRGGGGGEGNVGMEKEEEEEEWKEKRSRKEVEGERRRTWHNFEAYKSIIYCKECFFFPLAKKKRKKVFSDVESMYVGRTIELKYVTKLALLQARII